MMQDDQGRCLLRNSFIYEACCASLKSIRNPERCLDTISQIAALAWFHHPGRFADGALENAALRIGQEQKLPLPSEIELKWNSRSYPKTLHVATELYPTGGHTRVLAKWVARDHGSQPAVVVTRQRAAVPEFVEQVVNNAAGNLICLPRTDSLLKRAADLRQLGQRFDRIVLHSHPDDPIPIVAFARSEQPPVIMFNHAHFGFTLGPTVSDLIVNTLDYFRMISERFRFARRTECLSGVTGIKRLSAGAIDKDAAKLSLGLDSSSPVILTTGRDSYFKATSGYDFFRTARRLLDTNSNIQLLVVGIKPGSPLVPTNLQNEPRFHLLGRVLDPTPYFHAADICLESFPMPSLGAVVEAVAYGEAFPIPVYGEAESMLRVSLAPILNYEYRPRDEDDYERYVSEVLTRLPMARDQARAMRLSILRLEEEWDTRIDQLNRHADKLKHEPGEIPGAQMIDSYDNRVLAALRELDLSGYIDDLLIFRRATKTHLSAVWQGYEHPRELSRVGKRMWRGLRRQFIRST